MKDMSRRELLGGLAAGAALTTVPFITACAKAGKEKKPVAKTYKNADFYKDGKFDEEAAKKAYYELMEGFGYTVNDAFKEKFWVLDFAVGEFTSVGMGGVFWMNSEEGCYLGHEIFLLPGQMIPEHWHVAVGDIPPKLEAWHVRCGQTWHGNASEPADLPLPASFPKSQIESMTAKHVVKSTVHNVVELKNKLEKHWMLAGPEGAIVSEYASFHTNDGLRFSNPKAKMEG